MEKVIYENECFVIVLNEGTTGVSMFVRRKDIEGKVGEPEFYRPGYNYLAISFVDKVI